MDLLSIINRGNRRPSTGAIHLQPAHGITPHVDLNAIVNSRLFLIPNLTIQNSRVMLFFGGWTHFLLLICHTDCFTAIREYPITLLTTVDPADNIARSHTCLSRKFYFMFGGDTYNHDPNEPSSGEDDENDDDGDGDFSPEVSNRRSEQRSSPRPLPRSSSTLVQFPTPPIAPTPSPSMNSPPTSPVIHSNRLGCNNSFMSHAWHHRRAPGPIIPFLLRSWL